MARVKILSEREQGSGWVFDARVRDDEGVFRSHEVQLSWADYNLWSTAGADAPAAVASAAVRFLLSRVPPDELPARFDAATARRLHSGADDEIPQLIE